MLYILNSTETSVSPPSMKLANVTPVHKKVNHSEKENYRPVRILPNLIDGFITK